MCGKYVTFNIHGTMTQHGGPDGKTCAGSEQPDTISVLKSRVAELSSLLSTARADGKREGLEELRDIIAIWTERKYSSSRTPTQAGDLMVRLLRALSVSTEGKDHG